MPEPQVTNTDQEPLKPYPYREAGGATDIGAIRSLKMVAPYCPIEGNPLRGGAPNPRYTGEMNCQQAFRLPGQGRWDIEACEKAGHKPYYFTQETVHLENVVDKDGVISGQREIRRGGEKLNIIEVALSVRQETGNSMNLAVARGVRTLESFGFSSPCEYRQCFQPKRIHTKFGEYCSERHARLIAADFKKKILPLRGGDPNTEDQMQDERDEILDAINLGATPIRS